jgi:signal transduction histidine kinase
MDGFGNQWQTSYPPNGINYTLQPGKYILEIKCHPIFSAAVTFYKRFFITIQPPWWQTFWFRITAFVMSVAVIAFIVQRYNHRKYQAKIQALQMQHEIQHERERISRDLHDNMGSYAAAIMANVDEMIENKKMNETTFGNLKNNAREIMISLRDTIWALNKENITIAGISDHFKGYVQKIISSYPDKKFEVNEIITNDILLSPALGLNIFRIMQEAFTNALKHSNCNEIRVSVVSDKTFLITVSDDGTGINKNNLHKGNGIENMYSRAKESGLLFTINNKEGKGTEVVLSLEMGTIN